MDFRNHSSALLILATVTACAMAPAHADVLPPSAAVVGAITERLPAGDFLGYRPASVVTDWPMDPPLRVPTAGPTLLASWRGAPAGWNPPGLSAAGGGGRPDTDGDGRGASCERGNASFCPDRHEPPEPPTPIDPDRPQPGVPGPLPVLGLGAAWGWARRLRRSVTR
jgi:hypothetical protein